MTLRNLASKIRVTAPSFNSAGRQLPHNVSRSSKIQAIAGTSCDSTFRMQSSMRPMNRSPSSGELHHHGVDSSDREDRTRSQVFMCPKKSRRSYYGTVALDDPANARTWNSPVRHAPHDSLQEEDYDQWTSMAGYVPNKDMDSLSVPNYTVGDNYVPSPFDRSSAEQVMAMMESSYYYASYRARNHASSSSEEERGKR